MNNEVVCTNNFKRIFTRNNESVNEDADIGHQDDEPNM